MLAWRSSYDDESISRRDGLRAGGRFGLLPPRGEGGSVFQPDPWRYETSRWSRWSIPFRSMMRSLIHALRLCRNCCAVEVVAGRQELFRVGVGRGLAAFQSAQLDKGGVRVLPIRLDEFAKTRALGLL